MSKTQQLRSHLLTRLSNQEVETYLSQNDIIFVPVGVCEMHGIFPLDIETVVSEALALKLAEVVNGLVLNNLTYFYAGATAIGRGTIQVSIRTGIDYLYSLAKTLLEKGFRRQIYISFHGPAEMTIKPVVRDFFDDTKVPILYLNPESFFLSGMSDPAKMLLDLYSVFYAGLDIMGRLSDVPLTSELTPLPYVSDSFTGGNFQFGYLPGKFGFYFSERSDHNSLVPQMNTPEERQAYAEKGKLIIEKFVQAMNMSQVVEKMQKLDEFQNKEVLSRYGNWLPKTKI